MSTHNRFTDPTPFTPLSALSSEARERHIKVTAQNRYRQADDPTELQELGASPKPYPNIWCVRADHGKYTAHFVKGGYFGYGAARWPDLSAVNARSEIRTTMADKALAGKSNQVIGAYAGMMSQFLLDIQAGDWVITPEENRHILRYGQVEPGNCYYAPGTPDGCPYPMRRKIAWVQSPLLRDSLSMPLQYALRASKTVFAVKHREAFLEAIGQRTPSLSVKRPNPRREMLERILSLTAEEFQLLAGDLLAAMGFETEVTGKVGDGGVDVTGELVVPNLVTVKLFVQVKRYQLGTKITPNAVKQLRSSIPLNGQGAFITTAEYRKTAYDIATEPGFPPIGLINGDQLVDLLIEYWAEISPEFQEMLTVD